MGDGICDRPKYYENAQDPKRLDKSTDSPGSQEEGKRANEKQSPTAE
jgi:hypothetical protein